MRVAVVSDIHGNLPALDAVLADVRREGVTELLCCGDIASGPMPVETLDRLMHLDVPFRSVRGNADRAAVAVWDGEADPASTHEDDRWTGRELARRHRDFLAALPPTITVEHEGLGSVLLCHGTPRRDDEIVLETTPEQRLRSVLADVAEEVIVCGNTHMAFDRRVGDHRLVNVGSVGWPYGDPGAHWALLTDDLESRTTLYDVDEAIDELRRRSTWPRLEAFVDGILRGPPPRAEALAGFEAMAAADDQHHRAARSAGSD